MPAAGSIGTAYDAAPSMHDQYSARLDDNNGDNNLLYLSSRPQNIDHIRDDDIYNNNNVSGRDDNVSWNNDSAAYVSPQIGMNPIALWGLPDLEY